eukprot:scaffold34915_cov180-Amphora_coffeaeformis.AAC.1
MKEKRKTRLDKGTSSEFIGFNAFSGTSTFGSASPASNDRSAAWSPIYTGSDSTVQTAFSWLTSKRDPTTHVKALQSLTEYLSADGVSKKLQALVVQHWIWLYHRKVYFDATPAVRAAALQLWVQIRDRLPKAFGNLLDGTLSNDAPVVLGMLYSSLVDSSTEVQQVANDERTKKVLFEGLYNESASDEANTGTASTVGWEDGIMAFAEYILSCGRHSIFYERLLQGKKSTQTSSFSDLGEDQKDNVLETYTRVTGVALDALVFYLRHHPTGVANASSPNTSLWYKSLPSSHAILRRRTYALVSAVASRCPTLGLADLTQSLSSEKEPANWPTLLECLLAVTQASETKVLAAAYVQPVTKAWKKALYGANMTTAGPMLLPLTACTPTPIDVWKLLSAAWEGRELTLGGTDRWRKIQAVAESLSFGLLRKQTDMDVLAQYHTEWPELYGKIVLESLSTDPAKLTGTTRLAHADMLKSLSQQLPRIETVLLRPIDGANFPSNALEFLMQQHPVPDLTTRMLPLLDSDTGDVIQVLSSEAVFLLVRDSDSLLSDDKSPLIPLFRKLFESRCPRRASGDVPSKTDYQALEALMNVVSCRRLFGSDSAITMEKFVMNDLLRWVIIHTSRLAVGQPQNVFFVESEFRLLRRCLDSLENSERKKGLWEPFLREVVSAECDLQWMTLGLRTLIGEDGESDASWIRCSVLDNFVKGVEGQIELDGDDSFSEFSGEELDGERNAMDFLGLCFGISKGPSELVLVDPQIVKSLALDICQADHVYGSRPSPKERTLLRVVRDGRPQLLQEPDENKLLVHAWAQGSHRLIEDLLMCLKERPGLVNTFLTNASGRLRADLPGFANYTGSDYEKRVRIWASRASDLFRTCAVSTIDVPPPSFIQIGMADPALWSSQPQILFDLALTLFNHLLDPPERFNLLSNSTGISTSKLLVSILLALSQADTDLIKAEVVSNGADRCARFLNSIGGSAIDAGFVELCLRDAIARLENLCTTNNATDESSCRHVAVISQLAGALFRRLSLQLEPVLSAESIKEGDNLWYIPYPDKPNERVPAKVTKTHFDAATGHYFSIEIQKNEEAQERQTVVTRLRRNPSSTQKEDGLDPGSIPEEEKSERNAVRDLILHKLVLPNFSRLSWRTGIAELVNVVVSQVGLGEHRGLGSAHYDLFQILKKEVDALKAALMEGDVDLFNESAWKISMSFGFGVSVPPCGWLTSVFKIDPASILENIRTGFKSFASNTATFSSTLSVFRVLLRGAYLSEEVPFSDEMVSFISTLMEQNSQASCSMGFTSDTLLALKAFDEMVSLAPDSDATRSSLAETISILIRSFVSKWDYSHKDSEGPIWSPHFKRTLDTINTKKSIAPALRAAAAETAEGLASCLFSGAKQFIAFRLLVAASESKTPFKDEGHISLSESTERNIKKWTDGFTQEESEELMQDVEVVSQWLPLTIMTEVEKWHDETFERITEDESIGQFLVWLTVLQLIDTAAPLDFRNRPAFVTFLRLTESANTILNRAILFEKSVNDPKGLKNSLTIDPNALVQEQVSMDVETLSSLVLFRTTEVLPSLCRAWWEAECPKVYTNAVQTLVEKQIAPTILSRELSRVRSSADSFGDMNVSGSVSTRQVTAMYMQDDFTLKVLIQLPGTFPLRSAEVDCSKTLGVPQTRWKRWSLQITQMLNSQGGTLQDALLLWKDNVDKEFEGVEPCPVCYSVLHVKTHKLPSLECSTCNNRFHSDCLQQWFRQSGKSQCVLCQQDWRGTRVF